MGESALEWYNRQALIFEKEGKVDEKYTLSYECPGCGPREVTLSFSQMQGVMAFHAETESKGIKGLPYSFLHVHVDAEGRVHESEITLNKDLGQGPVRLRRTSDSDLLYDHTKTNSRPK